MPFLPAIAYFVAFTTTLALTWCGVRNHRLRYKHRSLSRLDIFLAWAQARSDLSRSKMDAKLPVSHSKPIELATQLAALHQSLNVNAGVNPEERPVTNSKDINVASI
jgi:hypothetical protein